VNNTKPQTQKYTASSFTKDALLDDYSSNKNEFTIILEMQ
jgi:hypothetical protein